MKALIVIALFLFLIFVGPILLIWSLNTLGITDNTPLNFYTWLAGFVFSGVIANGAKASMNNKI